MKIAQIREEREEDYFVMEVFEQFEFVEVLQYDAEDDTCQCRLKTEPRYWIDCEDLQLIRSEE